MINVAHKLAENEILFIYFEITVSSVASYLREYLYKNKLASSVEFFFLFIYYYQLVILLVFNKLFFCLLPLLLVRGHRIILISKNVTASAVIADDTFHLRLVKC